MGEEEGYSYSHSRRNPAVKRILQEIKEMESNPSDDFASLPLEEDIFEWQFAIRGPQDTEFEGGIYHGRIQLPAEYPFKPPSFMLLTPNGRFETQKKICLSISNYHPERWQPSWSVRTALVALIAFMPTNPDGALGSLDYPKEVRRELAVKSREAAPKYGSPERQKIIDEIHHYMLSKVPIMADIQSSSTTTEHANDLEEVAHADALAAAAVVEDLPDQELEDRGEDLHEVHIDAAAGPLRVRLSAGISLPRMRPDEVGEQSQRPPSRVGNSRDDQLLTWAAIGLTLAILFLLVKKFLKSNMFASYIDNL